MQRERNGLIRTFGVGLCLPHPLVITARAAVQVVRTIVDSKMVNLTVQCELCAADAVCAAADAGSEKDIVVLILCNCAHTKHNVGNNAISIRYKKGYENRTKIR